MDRIKETLEHFFTYASEVIKNPVVSKITLEYKLPKDKVLVYLPIIILINSIVLSLYSITGPSRYFNSLYGFKMRDIIITSFILTAIFFLIFGIIIVVTYNMIFKKEIHFIDTLRMAVNTTIVVSMSNFIVWLLGIISMDLLGLGLVITMALFTVMVISQLFTYLGLGVKTIYTIAIVYGLSLYLTLSLARGLIV